MPKLSIITINLNNKDGLKKTIESVFSQTFQEFEYLIIDGGSTDGSKELIENNLDKINYWVSEKDNGIYNAMNKGILKAKGEYILFMNSGDFLYNDNTVKEAFEKGNNEDIIYGDAKVDGKTEDENKTWTCPSNLTFKYFLTRTIHHTSAFIKRDLFFKWGLYNEGFKIMSDWEFFIKVICLHQVGYKHVGLIISCFNQDGISSQQTYVPVKIKEKKIVLNKYFKAFYSDLIQIIEANKEVEDRLLLYKNSRLHQLIEKLINFPLYKKFKKL